jgi:hypothetical protein
VVGDIPARVVEESPDAVLRHARHAPFGSVGPPQRVVRRDAKLCQVIAVDMPTARRR